MDFPPVVPAADGFFYVTELFDDPDQWEDAQERIYARLRRDQIDTGRGHWKIRKIERDDVPWCAEMTWTTRPVGMPHRGAQG